MDLQNHPAPMPLTRWIRIGDAAARLGLPSPQLLLTDIRDGRIPIRAARFGGKQLWHVDAGDLDRYERSFAAQGGLNAAR
jgi:hypothetical protein